MLNRLSAIWLPLSLILLVAVLWAGRQGTRPPAKPPEPKAGDRAAPGPVEPKPPPAAPAVASTAPAPAPAPPAPAVPAPSPYTSDTTASRYGTQQPEAPAAEPSTSLGPGPAANEPVPPWSQNDSQDEPGSTARQPDTSYGRFGKPGASTPGTGYGTSPPDTETTTTETPAVTPMPGTSAEAATALHLFDGFEADNAWAVESAADHATLALAEEHASEGQKALKAAFKAFGKGNFELRREVGLDLTDATTLKVDVYNDAGPMDLVLGLRAGYDTTLFTTPPKPLPAGWNRDVTFPLSELATSDKGPWGTSWSWSRDNVTRLSLIFREREEKQGTVYIDNLRFDRPATKLGAKLAPVLKSIAASAQTIERYETLEIRADFDATYQNFFDRAEVDLFASFFSPSGKRVDVHGFVYDIADAEPKPTWKIRFTPNEVGLWRYDVTVKDAGGETTSQTYQLLCRNQADHPGFIRISKSDPRYFESDSGAFYYPLGQNVCWAADYDYYLDQIQKYGGNYIRVWLCPWNLQLEDPREPGKFDLRTAKALDQLLQQCQARGIYLQLVLRYHGMQTDSWDKNPYNTANGGPCTWPGDFFSDSKAKDLHKRFLDYVAARWGSSPALFAWELWNEVDLARCDRESDLVAWHREMAGYLKKADAHGHLVTTSVSSPSRNFALFELPEIDFVPIHAYTRDLAEQFHDHYLRYRKLRKPVFVGEFSAGIKPSDDLEDPGGVHLRSGLWLALVSPMAGNAMPWWWDTFVDKNKLYPHWAALARFAKGIDRRGVNYELVRSKIDLGEGAYASLQGLVSPSEAYLWVFDETRLARPGRDDRPLLFAERPVRLHGMLGGAFRIEVWDTREGKILKQSTASTEDGTLAFTLPQCSRDIAVKVTREKQPKALPRLEW